MTTTSKRVEVIRMLELKGDMTQVQFAEKTGISQTSCSKIINNQQRLSSDNIIKLTESFDVSADWILGRTEKKNAPLHNQNECEITYGDVFKVITYLLQSQGLYPVPESFIDINGNTCTLSNIQSLIVNDKIIGSMFGVWSRTVTAPQSVYNSWRDECIAKYSEIPYITWDAAIKNACNHYFGGAAVSPELLKDFSDHLIDIFKELQENK